jgi:hypothetical protein
MNTPLKRFEQLIEQLLRKSLVDRRVTSPPHVGTVPLESGIVFAEAIVGAMQNSWSSLPAPAEVVDGMGQRRPLYRGLIVYAWLRTAEIAGRRWPDRLLRWCESLAANIVEASKRKSAAMGWDALALAVAAKTLGRSEWLALSSETFKKFAREQQSIGALFPLDSSINPETRWYEELALLHAMSSYAIETRDRVVQQGVLRAAAYHLAETQPDHATQQPWAIVAFLSNPETCIQAEEILHTAGMRDPKQMDGISLILLADALGCIRKIQVDGWMSTTSS